MIFRLIQFLKFEAAVGQRPWKTKQRVKLRPGFYPPGLSNPCELSVFECTGTVIRITGRTGVAWVKWDNGNSTEYFVGGRSPTPLRICDFPTKSFEINGVKLASLGENNPNVAFKKQKEQQRQNIVL